MLRALNFWIPFAAVALALGIVGSFSGEKKFRRERNFWLRNIPRFRLRRETIISIIVGFGVGLINYINPMLSDSWRVISGIFYIAMVAFYFYLAFMWRRVPAIRASELLIAAIVLVGVGIWASYTVFSGIATSVEGLLELVQGSSEFFYAARLAGWALPAYIVVSGLYCLTARKDDDSELRGVMKFASRVAFGIAVLWIAVSLILNLKFPKVSEKAATPAAPSEVASTEAVKETELKVEAKPKPVLTVVKKDQDPRFIQEEVSHKNYRLCFDFSNRMTENAREKLRVELIPEDTIATILNIAGHNAELLAIYAQGFGIYPDSSKYKELLISDGTYLSEKGIALYHMLEGALSVCKTVRASAPYDGTNTGYDGGFVIDFQPGISGDSMATRFTTPSGDVFYVMDRCGNFVYPDPPSDIPNGNTDEKKPGEDPVNLGNAAEVSGGNNKPADGSGEASEDNRDEENNKPDVKPGDTVTPENNNHGHVDPETVVPTDSPVAEEHKGEEASGNLNHEKNPMDYASEEADRGPVDPTIEISDDDGTGGVLIVDD